jgi:hypothetical protein
MKSVREETGQLNVDIFRKSTRLVDVVGDDILVEQEHRGGLSPSPVIR